MCCHSGLSVWGYLIGFFVGWRFLGCFIGVLVRFQLDAGHCGTVWCCVFFLGGLLFVA